jgi:predicted Zn-dependent protease
MQLKGGILARSGRTEEALDQFRAVLELAPDRLDVMVNICDALRYAGRLDEASRVLDDLERADPGHPGLEAKRRQIREATPAHPGPAARPSPEHPVKEAP